MLLDKEIWQRTNNCVIKSYDINSQKLYTIDNFFNSSELELLRNFSKTASYSRSSYGSEEAINEGEKPARSMNGKERWEAFFNPFKPFENFYYFLESMSAQLNIEISTIPWELSNGKSSSPATIANFLTEVSFRSTELGFHQDFNPSSGLPFLINKKADKDTVFSGPFDNGAQGFPYLLSIMIYATDESFDPSFGMGTRFKFKDSEEFIDLECSHGRIVIFEGDIWHSISPSLLPSLNTWRVSHVYKLILNPISGNQDIKKDLCRILTQSFTSDDY